MKLEDILTWKIKITKELKPTLINTTTESNNFDAKIQSKINLQVPTTKYCLVIGIGDTEIY